MCRGYGVEREGVLRIDRHRLGPRVYVLGARVHEWHLGAALLVALARRAALRPRRRQLRHDRGDRRRALARGEGLARPLPGSARHRRLATRPACPRPPAQGRSARRSAAASSRPSRGALAGLVNLASAVTPNIAWRNHLLLHVEPFETLKLSHAAAIPASMLLLVTAPYLWRRRQGALRLALVLLLGLTVLDLLKGLDLEAAAGSAGAAGVLWLGRHSFCVRHDPDTLRQALRRVPILAASSLLLCALAVWIAAPESAELRDDRCERPATRSSGRSGRSTSTTSSAHLDEAIGVVGLITLAWCAYLLFRPLAAPRVLPGRRASSRGARARAAARRRHARLLQAPPRPALPVQPGRTRLPRLPRRGGRAPRLGRPRRPGRAIPSLLRELSRFAETRGLRVAALGAGETLRPLWKQLGLRSMYLGDEAVVETGVVLARGPADPQGHGSRSRAWRSRATTAELSPARRALRRRAGRARGGQPELAPGSIRAWLRDVARRAPARRPRRQPRGSGPGRGRARPRLPALRPELRTRGRLALADAAPTATRRTG